MSFCLVQNARVKSFPVLRSRFYSSWQIITRASSLQSTDGLEQLSFTNWRISPRWDHQIRKSSTYCSTQFQSTTLSCCFKSNHNFNHHDFNNNNNNNNNNNSYNINININSNNNNNSRRYSTIPKKGLSGQYEKLKKIYCSNDPFSLLSFQVGDFYEFYDEQADIVGMVLGMQVSKKTGKTGPTKLAGFPLHRGSYHMARLVKSGYKVYVVEQGDTNEKDTKLLSRDVVRIITNGTLSEELEEGSNNYAVYISGSTSPADTATATPTATTELGLAWTDSSTGELRVATTSLATLLTDLTKISPTEIISSCSNTLQYLKDNSSEYLTSTFTHFTPSQSQSPQSPPLKTKHSLPSSPSPSTTTHLQLSDPQFASLIDKYFSTNSTQIARIVEPWPQISLTALYGLLSYLNSVFLREHPTLSLPELFTSQEYMYIDSETKRSMDILTSSSANSKACLLATIDNTSCALGKRLLKKHLSTPLVSVAKIERRLEIVSLFAAHLHQTELVQSKIRACKDIERTLQWVKTRSAAALRYLSNVEESAATATTQQESDPVQLAKTRSTDPKAVAYRKYKTKRALNSVVEQLGLLSASLRACVTVGETIRHFKEFHTPIIKEILESLNNSSVKAILSYLEAHVVTKEDLEEKKISGGRRKASTSTSTSTSTSSANESSTLLDEDLLDKEVWVLKPAIPSSTLATLNAEIETLKQRLQNAGATLIEKDFGYDIKFLKSSEEDILKEFPDLQVRDKKSPSVYYSKILDDQTDKKETAETQDSLKTIQKIVSDLESSSLGLQLVANTIAQIDVAVSHAITANKLRFSRPTLVPNSNEFIVTGGFHSVIEKIMHDRKSNTAFARNDCYLTGDTPKSTPLSSAQTSTSNVSVVPAGNRCWVITGANMGGKSTFMRQNAHIAILAQIGSFVPADSVKMGPIDRLFARIGASDNISENQSTFMVEMLETARILKQATKNSLVIIDELGRGTATADGLAISWAVLQYLHSKTQCKLLFATHFHEIARMCAQNPSLLANVSCFFVQVIDNKQEGLLFTHKIVPGIAERSYGVEVAALAGVPEEVLENARQTRLELMTQQKPEQILKLQKM